MEGGDEGEDGWEVGNKLSPESRGSATITERQGSVSLTTGDVGPSRGRKPGSALGCAPGLQCGLGGAIPCSGREFSLENTRGLDTKD